jgi:hypothetical protein
MHLRDECVCGQVECEEEGCGIVLVRGELKGHREEVHGIVDVDKEESNDGESVRNFQALYTIYVR